MRAVASFAGQHGVKVVMDSQDGLPAAVLDKDRIEQVVINLLSNAIKFSPDNGEVRVRIACDGPWFQCSVIDQGCGIAEPTWPRYSASSSRWAIRRAWEAPAWGSPLPRDSSANMAARFGWKARSAAVRVFPSAFR